MDFKLTDATSGKNDLDITNGALSFVTGIDYIAQKVRIKLQTFLGECPYRRDGGTPWLAIFESGTNPELNAKMILTQTIEAIDGVNRVVELNVDLDRNTRTAQVTGSAIADSGERFNFQGAV